MEVISFNPLITQMRKPRSREVKRQEDRVVGKSKKETIDLVLFHYICNAHGKSRF